MDIAIYLGVIAYICDKIGLFGFITKLVHANLPRERSLAIKHLTRTQVTSITIKEPGQVEGSCCFKVLHPLRVEYMEMVLVCFFSKCTKVFPYYSVISVSYMKETDTDKLGDLE